MAQVRVTIKREKSASTRQTMVKFQNVAEASIAQMAKDTALTFREVIKENIKRQSESTGKLESGFFAKKIGPLSWAVGDINYLNGNIPYWRHIDQGSIAIGANWKHRLPTGSFTDTPQPASDAPMIGTWQPGGLNHSFIPKMPIPPMNYIAKSVRRIPQIIRNNLSRGR